MLIPAVILTFIFSYIPLYGLIIAFQDYKPAQGFHSPWVGLENFRYIFSLKEFSRTIGNTVFIAVLKIIGNIVVPVTIALLLNEIRSTKLKRAIQTSIYVPNFMSWVILAGLFMDLLATDGVLNSVITRLGGKVVPFLNSAKLFPYTIVLTDVWKSFGFGTVIYLAALTGIDPGLYEAAIVDGANKWQQVFHITLPGIRPIVILMTVLALQNVLNAGFDQVYNMYSPLVYSTGDIMDTFIYRLGFQQAQYDIATAVGLFKSLVSAVLIGIAYFLADKLANYRIF